MYTPVHFQETDSPRLHALMRAYPLGAWVVHDGHGIEINHLPFMLDSDGTLVGHVARANPVWQRCHDSPSVVIFTGEQGYVSPTWYSGKQEHHRVVPTWNYAVVHAHGVADVVDDRSWLRNVVTHLTEVHESNNPQPWRITDAPADYIEKMLDAIVGIRIRVKRLEGKFKLSQNRSTADQQGVIAGLRTSGNAGTQESSASMMQNRSPRVAD